MLSIQEKVDLKPYNTFGIKAEARLFVDITNEEEARAIFQISKDNVVILGGGSNVLFTKDYNGLIVHNSLKGIEVIDKDDHHVTVKVASGENWHEFVKYAIDQNWGGLENLSLIPGTVGAAPMQNIGAYGVEVKETIVSVDAIDRSTGEKKTFTRDECRLRIPRKCLQTRLEEKYLFQVLL